MNPQTEPAIGFPKPSKKPLIAAVIFGILFVAAAAFGYWAFNSCQDYKNNTNEKIAAAVASAKQVQAAQLQAQFDQENKQPYKTFTGPSTYGSVTFNYPKTWDAYVDETGTSNLVEAYFYPGEVPSTNSNTAYALRVELVNSDYASVLQQMQSNVQAGKTTASAYIPPKMKTVNNAQVGTRFDGQVSEDASGNPQTGSMIVLRVRDKTLEIYTESNSYLDDFNNTVLASLTYQP